jgi:hypothetical protein
LLQRAAEFDDVAQGVAELHERTLGGVAHGLPILNLVNVGSLSRSKQKRSFVTNGGNTLQPFELLVILVEFGVTACKKVTFKCLRATQALASTCCR